MPEWAKDAVIYEVNMRQHTAEGTFDAFTKDIPRLKSMGIDILWIMPIQEIGIKNRKGVKGSYYSIQDYRKVNHEFGSLADFKEIHLTKWKMALNLSVRLKIFLFFNHKKVEQKFRRAQENN